MNHLFDQIRDRMPEPAKPFMDVAGRGILSYGDMLADTARLANALVEAGVEPGDRVAVQVAKSPEAMSRWTASFSCASETGWP